MGRSDPRPATRHRVRDLAPCIKDIAECGGSSPRALLWRHTFMSGDIQDDTMDETRDEGSNRIAWFVTGALIGATVGMLFAPKSGKDTRQFLNDKTQQGREAV